MTFHDGSTRTNVYDEADDVITLTDENGSRFSNAFDALGRKMAVSISLAAGVTGTTSQSMQYDGLSRTTFARDTVSGVNADVTLVYDSLDRVLEDAQTYAGHARYVTNTAFKSYPVSEFTFPSGRQVTNSYDLLYRRTLAYDETGAYDIASWSFFGPARVAQVQLANGLVCTWMNNAGTNSAVQPGVPNPGWTSGDFLGYDGAGRMIAKRDMTSDLSTLRVRLQHRIRPRRQQVLRAGPACPGSQQPLRAVHWRGPPGRLRFARPPAAVPARHAGLDRRLQRRWRRLDYDGHRRAPYRHAKDL